MHSLQELSSIRKKSKLVLESTLNRFFDLNMSKMDNVVDFVVELIRRDYKSPLDVPFHSRWRHFDVGGKKRIHDLFMKNIDSPIQTTKLIIDLFVVSVLLDAGAGNNWSYLEADTGKSFGRSEGLAIASLHMFIAGDFSSDPQKKCQVDALGLKNLTVEKLTKGFQVDADKNPLIALDGRVKLLNRLGEVLLMHPLYFGKDPARPGNIVDYLLNHSTTKKLANGYVLKIEILWEMMILGFGDVWPASRTTINGKSLGDVWPCLCLTKNGIISNDTNSVDFENSLVPFHKLSQWLTYSLLEPMSVLIGVQFEGLDLMTGLAEYRNGGLFVDFNVIQLKKTEVERGLSNAKSRNIVQVHGEEIPYFESSDPVIVEWRALTVALLDIVGDKVRSVFGFNSEEMPLVKVLEGGTWKAGREIAKRLRPVSNGPPIQIISDGTVF